MYTLYSSSSCAWWGSTRCGASAPPADPQLSILRVPPHPPPWPSFKVLWRGKGGQGRLSTPHVAGRSAGQPSLAHIPKKVMIVVIKGAVTSWVTRPMSHLLLMHAKLHASNTEARSGKGLVAEAETKKKQNTDRREGQRPRGVFRVWVPGWHTHIQHSPSATTEKP